MTSERERFSRRGFFRVLAGEGQADGALPAYSLITYDGPVLTHAGRFYVQPGLTGQPPLINRHGWTLAVAGWDSRPQVLTYAELRALPAHGEMRTLVSRHRRPGGEQVGNAVWRGAYLRDLIPGLATATGYLRLGGRDGYATTIPLALAQEVLLAYEMNGALLPPEHGGPLRALVPGVYGGKSVRWLGEIALTDRPERGLRECLPAEDDLLPVRTFAQIMTPQPLAQVAAGTPVAVQGVAFAGGRRITRVEVSVDGGPWVLAALRPPESPYAWTQWYLHWMPELTGPVSFAARATDATGMTQPENAQGDAHAEPIHRVTLVVI